jgi:hypothetical protein
VRKADGALRVTASASSRVRNPGGPQPFLTRFGSTISESARPSAWRSRARCAGHSRSVTSTLTREVPSPSGPTSIQPGYALRRGPQGRRRPCSNASPTTRRSSAGSRSSEATGSRSSTPSACSPPAIPSRRWCPATRGWSARTSSPASPMPAGSLATTDAVPCAASPSQDEVEPGEDQLELLLRDPAHPLGEDDSVERHDL